MLITANKQYGAHTYSRESATSPICKPLGAIDKKTQKMYDYISLQGNSDFSISIDIDKLKQVFSESNGFKVHSNASAMVQFGDHKIVVQGIKCDRNGNYAFYNDSSFTEINLIEINIPQGAESEIEEEIRQLATVLALKLDWQIDWRE